MSSPFSLKEIIKKYGGYIVAVICLLWVFYDISWKTLLSDITSIRWWWIFPAVLFDILTYFFQGIRWRLLLSPLGSISSLKTTQAIYVGLFTNEILPLRIGELVRIYLASKWLKCSFSSVVPSVVIERFFDGFWVAFAIAVSAIFVKLPGDFIKTEKVLIAILVILAFIFIYMLFRHEKLSLKSVEINRSAGTVTDYIRGFMNNLIEGVRKIGLSKQFFKSLFLSSFVLIFQMISLWFLIIAYGINLSVLQGAVVLLILHLGTAIPNTPSNTGTYQFFAVLGLMLFGVDKTTAAGFSVVAFLILTIPLWLLGLISLWKTGISYSTLHREAVGIRGST